MNMHIIIDAHLAVKKIDGVARYLMGLLSELPQLDPSHHYTVLSLPPEKSCLPEELFAQPNVRRVELNLMGPSPKQHLKMRLLFKELQADVYHHPQYDLPRGVRVPSVVTIHDLKYIFHPEFLQKYGQLKSFYIKNSLRHSLEKADRIIAVSQSTLNDLSKVIPTDPEKVTVIHHGLDLRNVHDLNQASERFASLHDFLLFVGTRRPHKNIEGLIRALAILRNDYQYDVNLVVCGKAYAGYTRPEALIAELRLEGHVHLLDFVPDQDLSSLYHASKIVTLVSFYEGFGLPLLEGMAHGKPVVGANVSSIPEVIGDAGLLADPYDPADIAHKLHQILDDPKLYKSLAHKGQIRAAQFSWLNVAKTTLNVYIEAFNSKLNH